MFITLFFIFFIGHLRMQFYQCCFVFPKLSITFTWINKKLLANCKCSQEPNKLNQMHLRTYLVCFEIIPISSEKVCDIFLQDFLRFMYSKMGKIDKKNIKAAEKQILLYFKNRACLAKILKLEDRVAVFSKTFYLLHQQK